GVRQAGPIVLVLVVVLVLETAVRRSPFTAICNTKVRNLVFSTTFSCGKFCKLFNIRVTGSQKSGDDLASFCGQLVAVRVRDFLQYAREYRWRTHSGKGSS